MVRVAPSRAAGNVSSMSKKAAKNGRGKMMAQKVVRHTRVPEDLAHWLDEYAADHGWTVSRTICALLVEQRKDIQCREMIRKADGRETASETVERINRRVERKQQESI